jgi:hypothetical protein
MEAPSLTPEDWLNPALNELRKRGRGTLKAQPLVKKLNVTRGESLPPFSKPRELPCCRDNALAMTSSDQINQAAREAADPQKALGEFLQKGETRPGHEGACQPEGRREGQQPVGDQFGDRHLPGHPLAADPLVEP